MIKTSAAALLLSSALMTGAAFAQTATTTDTAPAAGQPAMTTGQPVASPAATSGSAQFLTEQDQGQYRASRFVGLAIYGPDNQRIGDVNEILIDGTGNAKAVVIGVGGFLGIGEKNVAVPFSAVEWVNERPVTTASTSGTAATGTAATNASPPAASSAGMGAGTTASRDASTTGSTTAAPARSTAETAAANGYPDHGKVRMSKSELQNAPTFKWYGDKK